MENVLGVTRWIEDRLLEAGEDPEGRVLRLIRTREDNSTFFVDEEGEYWRMYDYIEEAVCYEKAQTLEIFRESAAAFGNFQRQLCGYPADELWETIPDFHNTPVRLEQFMKSVSDDKAGRLSKAKKEADFLMEHSFLAGRLFEANRQGLLPVRVTHNDTKLNNVMIDKNTGRGKCILDLDTVMPGFSVTDFGDAIRFGASTAAEDEPDIEKVHFSMRLYEIYASGFIEGCGGALTDGEVDMLPDGALVITYEQALRFLADYLDGDTYYKVSRPDHNLQRARTQIRLLEEMEASLEEMRRAGGQVR